MKKSVSRELVVVSSRPMVLSTVDRENRRTIHGALEASWGGSHV